MREIKFRAWDKFYQKWIEINAIDFDNKIIYECGGRKIDFDKVGIVQFTGLKDKNGKEIYEGDIVKHNDKFGNGKGIVEFDAPSFGLSDKDGFCNDWVWKTWEEEFEVIGNIYENPELLDASRSDEE